MKLNVCLILAGRALAGLSYTFPAHASLSNRDSACGQVRDEDSRRLCSHDCGLIRDADMRDICYARSARRH